MSTTAEIRNKFDRLRAVMDERMCRLWTANEALELHCGGESIVSAATGVSRATIRAGIKELERLAKMPVEAVQRYRKSTSSTSRLQCRIRRPGAGRKLTEVSQPGILTALERLLSDEVGGDPMTEQRWVRSSLRYLSMNLKREGYRASSRTVRRLLKDLGFSLKANKRKQGRRGCLERDTQFNYIASQRKRFIAEDLPVISVDTKKKELIGEFRKNGRTWRRKPEEVHEHDFPGVAQDRAVPFGVYDIAKNAGYVFVGLSHDTPDFAVKSICRWWKNDGFHLYPDARELLILADGGGCNGCHTWAWKFNLQQQLCDKLGLIVTVCHYPTGCSKWNPVEHRLFSYISINWAGKPLKTLEMMLGYIRGTTTATGLKIKAYSDKDIYTRGQEVTREQQETINLTSHDVCPEWNYTLRPTKSAR
jgi:transposase